MSLTAPANGAVFTAPASFTVAATAAPTQRVTRVELWRNGQQLGQDLTAPYQFNVSALPTGTYRFEARAVASDGTVKVSGAITVRVDTPAPPPTGNHVLLRQGESGYGGTTDIGVTNQYVQYNGGRGVVSDDARTGAYKVSGSGAYEARTFVRFGGLESLRGRTVVKAQLSLSFNFGASGYKLAGQYLAKPWNPSAPGFGWGKRNDVDRWSLPGSGAADWISGKKFEVTGFTGNAADTRAVLLDPAVVQGWINNPQANYGFVLMPTTSNKISWVRSAEDPTPSYRPTLEVWLK